MDGVRIHARRRRLTIGAAVITIAVCAISALHYVSSTHAVLVHEILKRLYYVPIVVGAILYGVRGGLATSLLASALYLPHILGAWSGWPVFEAGRYGEIILFNIVGAVTGIMADRLREERNRYYRAHRELETAYARLEVSTEERLKSERMATVGRVAAGMAHEIRTPLSGLLGCFEILGSDYPPGHPKAEFVDIARVERLVTAFLDFAQPPPPSPRSVDLNQIAENVKRLVGPVLAERGGVNIQPSGTPAVPVTADAHQVERALIDLLLTASSLAPHGSVTLSTETRDTVGEITVVVEPFDRTLPDDLFEPFADERIASGLTLAVVERLIENQGGKVCAQMKGRRARFVVELPAGVAGTVRVGAGDCDRV